VLIICPEEYYRMCGVSECDREASIKRRPWPTRGCFAMGGLEGDIHRKERIPHNS
jgi:hypothetical protein